MNTTHSKLVSLIEGLPLQGPGADPGAAPDSLTALAKVLEDYSYDTGVSPEEMLGEEELAAMAVAEGASGDREAAAKVLAKYMDEQAYEAGQGIEEIYGPETAAILANYGFTD